jgi:DNA-binding transcriptional LysR family regulator
MAHIDRALRSNIKLRHLQLIVALDEFRHLGRTADFLSVSQPAVSKMLTEVENMLGLQLFLRSTRSTEPTPAGIALLRFARSVLAQYERTREEIAAASSGAAGTVRIGAMSGTLPVLVSKAVEDLKTRSAQARVLIEEGDLTHLLPKLRVNELDLFVGRLEPGYAAPDLLAQPLHHDPMVMIVSRDHPLATSACIAWDDLAGIPCVMPPPWASLRVKLEQEYYRHRLTPPTDLIETSSYFAMMTFVQQRACTAFVAQSVGEHLESSGQFSILPLPMEIDLPPIGIITLRNHNIPTTAQQLIDCLHQAASKLFSDAAGQWGQTPQGV